MAVTHQSVFTQTPNMGFARLAAANTARDGSGTIVTCFTAAADGSRLDRITVTSAQATAAANSSANVFRVYVTDTAGANPRLRAEIVIPVATASNTAVGAQATVAFPGGLILASGQLVRVTIAIYAGAQDQMDVCAEGADF